MLPRCNWKLRQIVQSFYPEPGCPRLMPPPQLLLKHLPKSYRNCDAPHGVSLTPNSSLQRLVDPSSWMSTFLRERLSMLSVCYSAMLAILSGDLEVWNQRCACSGRVHSCGTAAIGSMVCCWGMSDLRRACASSRRCPSPTRLWVYLLLGLKLLLQIGSSRSGIIPLTAPRSMVSDIAHVLSCSALR